MQSLNGVLTAPMFPDSAPLMKRTSSLSNCLASPAIKYVELPGRPANIGQHLKFLVNGGANSAGGIAPISGETHSEIGREVQKRFSSATRPRLAAKRLSLKWLGYCVITHTSS